MLEGQKKRKWRVLQTIRTTADTDLYKKRAHAKCQLPQTFLQLALPKAVPQCQLLIGRQLTLISAEDSPLHGQIASLTPRRARSVQVPDIDAFGHGGVG